MTKAEKVAYLLLQECVVCGHHVDMHAGGNSTFGCQVTHFTAGIYCQCVQSHKAVTQTLQRLAEAPDDELRYWGPRTD